MRTKLYFIANWKMNFTSSEALNYFEKFPPNLEGIPAGTEVVIVPPFTLLPLMRLVLNNSHIKWGAQNIYFEKKGAYTGEISPLMIKDYGATYVILGHSERRKYFKESNALVAKKLMAAMENDLLPVVCVGEDLEQRESGETFSVLEKQLKPLCQVWKKVNTQDPIIIAYEPVWAIGTGVNATPKQAQEAHQFIKSFLKSKKVKNYDNVYVLYGGSVNSNNVSSLIEQPDISGCLVGGSSLIPEEFLKIIFTKKEV